MKTFLAKAFARGLVLAGLLHSAAAFAWPPVFGPEFTFTNEEIREVGNRKIRPDSPLNLAKLEEWSRVLTERCEARKNCSVEKFIDKHGTAYRVKFDDGWYYNISIDMAALEVQTKQGTLKEFRSRKDFIQKEIFDTAASLGITPHERTGQGHIHLGLTETFGNDPQLFRNFVVDYSNRPELAWGALGNHLGNSPPLAALKPEQREAFAKVLQDFDANPGSITDLAQAIDRQVYTESTIPQWGGPAYYQALRFDRFSQGMASSAEETVEMRGFRPQRSAEEFVLEMELLEARLKYLKKVKAPIPFTNPPTHELAPEEVVARFHDYVTESGLKWDRYRKLLPPSLENVPLDPQVVATIAAEKAGRAATPFNEVRDAKGGLREGYRGVYDVYESMSESQRENFEKATKKEAAGNRRLLPLPRVLTIAERDEIQKGVAQRAEALRRLLEDVAKGDFSRIERFGLPRSVVEGALKRSGEAKWVKELKHDNIAFPYGPDLIRGPDGKFYVIEDNTGFVGGLGDSSYSREQLLRHLPQYRQFLEQDQGKSAVDIMVEHFRKMATPPDGELVMVMHPQYEKNNATLSKQLEERGMKVISDSSLLKATNEGVFLREKSGWKRVGLLMPKNLNMEYFMNGSVPGLMEAVQDGKVALGYRPGIRFLGDKEIAPFVGKLIRGYLKEKPILAAPETHSLQRIAKDGSRGLDKKLARAVETDREAYVVKKADGLGGDGVWIGKKSGDKEWKALMREARANPGRYIVQKFTPLSEFEGNIVDMRPVTYVSPSGVEVADHFWARALPVDGNGKVNVSIDGKVTAVFATDPAKYPAHPEFTAPVAVRQGACSRFFSSLFGRLRPAHP